jgi:hypothetical protein
MSPSVADIVITLTNSLLNAFSGPKPSEEPTALGTTSGCQLQLNYADARALVTPLSSPRVFPVNYNHVKLLAFDPHQPRWL